MKPPFPTRPTLRHRWRLYAAISLLCVQRVAASCELDAVHPFAIETRPLGEALLQIARVSGCTVAFSAENTRTFVSKPVHGRMTVRQAMAQALTDSRLETRQTLNGSLTVRARRSVGPVMADQ